MSYALDQTNIVNMSDFVEEPEEFIRHRAFFIYEERVRENIPGTEEGDWQRALAESRASQIALVDGPVEVVAEEEAPEISVVEAEVTEIPGATMDAEFGLLYSEKPAEADDLKKISGVGPVMEKELNKFGVYTFAQIASWKDKEIAAFSTKLGSFANRVTRDEWVKQAKALKK